MKEKFFKGYVLQYYSFKELTQEVADRFIKRVIVYDEKNIEVEWKFSESFSGYYSQSV